MVHALRIHEFLLLVLSAAADLPPLLLTRFVRTMWDNHDFILGVKLHLPTEENKKEMLDAIKSGWVKTPEDAVIYSMAIYEDAPFED